MKKSILCLSSIIFLVSCGGGGGGGGGSDIAPPSGGTSGTTYSYTKVTDTVSNYTWDAIATGTVTAELSSGYYTYNNSSVYYEDFISAIGFSGFDNYNLEVTFTEVTDSSSFDFMYSGQTNNEDLSISWNFNINDFNVGLTDLYEFGDTTPSYGLADVEYADSLMSLFGPYDAYLSSVGLEYVNGLQLAILEKSNNNEYILPTIFGDLTETGDMPTGNKSISFESISYYLEQDYSSGVTLQLAVGGDGNLSVDHSNNTISGTMTFRRYADLTEFLLGNGATNQYSSLPAVVLTISNGQIVGNKFSADLVADDTNNSGLYLTGKMSGGFFGPSGREIGASFFVGDADGDDSDYYYASGFLIGEE